MEGILSPENLSTVMTFVVPGFIALSVRSQFVTGVSSFETKERFLSYVAISVVYGSLAMRVASPDQFLNSTWIFFLVLFVGPVILGLILGINIQKDVFRRVLSKLGLFTVHPVPTAWGLEIRRITEGTVDPSYFEERSFFRWPIW